MKTIYFDNIEILYMLMFPLSKKHYFRMVDNSDDWFDNAIFETESFRFIHSNHIYNENRHKIKYDKNTFYVLDRNNIFAGRNPNNPPNRNVFLKMLEQNLKVLILDIEGEPLFVKDDTITVYDFLEIIEFHPSCEMITNRDFDFKCDRIYTNNVILPLLGFYFKLQDRLYLHPPICDFENKEKKYDFVAHLGLSDSKNTYTNWRSYLLSKIDFLDKSIFLPNTYNFELNYIQKLIQQNNPSVGSYTWFSVIESEQAKVKLVFETMEPWEPDEKHNNFLTEKTLKCFLHTQPYIIFMTEKNKILLKELGFLFPESGNTFEEQIDYINNICKDNLDSWIDDNKHIFIHNKKLFNNILFSNETKLVTQFLNFINPSFNYIY